MSFPQFPYGSPAELTRSKHIPGAGFAPVITEGGKKQQQHHVGEFSLITWRTDERLIYLPPTG